MKNLSDFIGFVKGQMEFHERRSRNPEYNPMRRKLHEDSATTFRELAEALERAPKPIASLSDPLALSPDDLTGLPPELLAQLNVTEGDRLDAAIVDVINSAGGTLLLDKILIALYKSTGDVHQRAQIVSRIYRMSKRGLVRSVPRRKGVYTTLDTASEPDSDPEPESDFTPEPEPEPEREMIGDGYLVRKLIRYGEPKTVFGFGSPDEAATWINADKASRRPGPKRKIGEAI